MLLAYIKKLSMYVIQHSFICCPSDYTVSEDAGREPRIVATWHWRSNQSARSHLLYFLFHGTQLLFVKIIFFVPNISKLTQLSCKIKHETKDTEKETASHNEGGIFFVPNISKLIQLSGKIKHETKDTEKETTSYNEGGIETFLRKRKR